MLSFPCQGEARRAVAGSNPCCAGFTGEPGFQYCVPLREAAHHCSLFPSYRGNGIPVQRWSHSPLPREKLQKGGQLFFLFYFCHLLTSFIFLSLPSFVLPHHPLSLPLSLLLFSSFCHSPSFSLPFFLSHFSCSLPSSLPLTLPYPLSLFLPPLFSHPPPPRSLCLPLCGSNIPESLTTLGLSPWLQTAKSAIKYRH